MFRWFLRFLETAIGDSDSDSRLPFPYSAYNRPLPALYAGDLQEIVLLLISKGSPDILSTEFPAGDNITAEQADVLCHQLNEEFLQYSLAALVGLSDDATKAKHRWIQNDVCYFVACKFDFGSAYAAARHPCCIGEHSVDPNIILIHRGQWHKHARVLNEA